ncbi:MAG TPA: hypothetical protein VNQ77_00260 [Frankiaceae bacterium]|nr:hypothetical protein [Frankiaceae bacterium]
MRRVLVPVLVLALSGPVPASAAPASCPQAVLDVRGRQPTTPQVSAALDAAAAAHGVPKPVLRAVAYVEAKWRQFRGNDTPYFANEAACEVGLLQVDTTGYAPADQVRLAADYVYNAGEGARLLREQWDATLEAPPAGGVPDGPDVVENWFHAICGYRSCGSDPAYPTTVANVVADPFRHAPNFPALRPYWFTKPQDADPSYVFPGAFQARFSPAKEFVFYDAATGAVTSTVAAPTHSLATTPAPNTTYPNGHTGPDGRNVTCFQCAAWELAKGTGVIGRARWTTTTAVGAAETVVEWAPRVQGRYRVSVYVPALGDATLGTVTYSSSAAGDRTVDQEAAKGTWVSLGDRDLSPMSPLEMSSASGTAGMPIVADAVRMSGKTTLAVSTAMPVMPYGTKYAIKAQLRHGGRGASSQPVRFYRRPLGTTTWRYAGTDLTNTSGDAFFLAYATVNMEYQARFVPPDAAYLGSTSGGTQRLLVNPVITGTISDVDVRYGTKVTIRARVRPAHAGFRFYLQRAGTSGWLTITSTPLTATGSATFTFTPRQGSHLYRVYLPGHADHLSARTYGDAIRAT